ncbi:MAG: hypothetical protein ACRDS1_01640 [Pseudonocardiaceae bacterium]
MGRTSASSRAARGCGARRRGSPADYTQEEIDRKRLSLEGVLVPVTAKWNVEMLRAAGFQQVDCFWR